MAEDNNRQKRNITGAYPGVTGAYNPPKRPQEREFTTPESGARRITPRYDFTKREEQKTVSEPTRVQSAPKSAPQPTPQSTAQFSRVRHSPARPQAPEYATRVDMNTVVTPPVSRAEAVKSEAAPKPDKAERFDFKAWFSKDNVRKFLRQLRFYGIILIVSILLTFGIVNVANDVFAFVKPEKSIVVTLKKGASTQKIAKELEKAGVIEYSSVFRLYSKLRHADGKYQFGEYTLNSNLGYDQIIAQLQRSSVQAETVTFTVPVGCTQDELINMLTSKKYFDGTELENALNNYKFEDHAWVGKLPERRCRLEGYILAGDYDIAIGESATSLVEKFIVRFEETVLTKENKELIKASGLTTDEVIIFASLLQKECGTPDMYKPAAAVIYNRLNAEAPMHLQLTSPINYVLSSPKSKLSADDKRTESEYNTYKYVGLPIGPITSPSVEAINAVLSPEVSANLFFISDGDKAYYAATAADHEKNLKKASDTAKGTDTIR